MKTCSKCGDEKSIDEFSKNRKRKDGHSVYCKKCVSIYAIGYYKKTIDHKKEYTENHKEEKSEYDKKYYITHKQEKKKHEKERYIKLKEGKKEYNKKYRIENRGKLNKKDRERYKNNISYRINKNISSAIRKSLEGNKNGRHWEDLVGYDTMELKKHLEAQFKSGMTWGNYGHGNDKWNIDHRIPISLFNIDGIKSKGFKKCWELSNLQPLWQPDNFMKNNKLFIL